MRQKDFLLIISFIKIRELLKIVSKRIIRRQESLGEVLNGKNGKNILVTSYICYWLYTYWFGKKNDFFN